MHDTIKLILVFFIGDTFATKIHRKFARHHNIRTSQDFAEAYLDWASARYTKKDKPLDAVETARIYFPEYYAKAISFYQLTNYR